MMRVIRTGPLLFLLGSALYLPGCFAETRSVPKAQNGLLDLRNFDFASAGEVYLNGEWEFFWNQLPDEDGRGLRGEDLIVAPGGWNGHTAEGRTLDGMGTATYRLRVLLPANAPQLALNLGQQHSAYRAWVNGHPLAGSGRVSLDPAQVLPEYAQHILDLPREGELELVLAISNQNQRRGGFLTRIAVGESRWLHASHDRRSLLEAFNIGALLIMGLYHLGLFIYRRKDQAAIYFTALCFVVLVRIMCTGEQMIDLIIPGFPWKWKITGEYLGFYAGLPAFMLYTYYLFPKEFDRWIFRTLTAIGVISALAVLLTPATVFTHTLNAFQVIAVVGMIYIVFIQVQAVRRQRLGARMSLAGSIVFFATVAHDIVFTTYAIGFGHLASFGLVAFIAAQSAALSRRFALALETSEELTENLERNVLHRTQELAAERDRASMAQSEADEARKTAEYERRAAEKLAEISRVLNETTDLELVTKLVFDHLGQEYGLEACFLVAPQPGSNALATVSHSEITAEQKAVTRQFRIPAGEGGGIVRRAFERGKPLYVQVNGKRDIFKRDYPGIEYDRQLVLGLGLQWFLLIPLVVRNESIGLVLATSFSAKLANGLRQDQIREVSSFADQIAGAIHSTNLFNEVLRSRLDAQDLADIARRANETENLDSTLAAAVELFTRRLQAASLSLFLLDEEGKQIKLRAAYLDGKAINPASLPPVLQSLPMRRTSGSVYRTLKLGRQFAIEMADFKQLIALSPVDSTFVGQFKLTWAVHTPIAVNGKTIGVFSTTGRSARLPDLANQQFMERALAQVAGAVRTQDLLEQTAVARAAAEREREHSEILAALARESNRALDLDAIVSLVAEILGQRYGATVFGLAVTNREQGVLRIQSMFLHGQRGDLATLPQLLRKIPLGPRSGTIYRSFQRKRVFHIDHINRQWLESSPVDKAFIEFSGANWIVHLPILLAGEVEGILLMGGAQRGHMNRAELEFCTRIGDQVAGAVHATRLLHDTQLAQIASEAARAESDRLLTNILPVRVADELKREGRVAPHLYDSVSVLFTDFVGFTAMTERLRPGELIAELDGCFSQFDEVVKRNSLEKLKTIGDAYMCAGGLPTPNRTHPVDTVLAALEFRALMRQAAEIKNALGMEFWRLRIGIHSGPVTAGVVGNSKFAYDIWGDTVNTASRMESSGEPGEVNISGATYSLVKDFFICEPRGRVKAKGKGDVEMFFVRGIRPDLAQDREGAAPNVRFQELRAALNPEAMATGSRNGLSSQRLSGADRSHREGW